MSLRVWSRESKYVHGRSSISFGGKLTLVNRELEGIPTHLVSLTSMVHGRKQLNKFRRGTLRRKSGRKIHLGIMAKIDSPEPKIT